jgi:hypothetical protein
VPKGKDIGRQQTASHDLEALVKQAEKLKVEEVPYPTAFYILPTTSTQPSNDDPPHDREIPPNSHCVSVKVDPPITGLALEELDVRTIINQHGLRHNINFEPDLSYQPDHYSTQGQQARRNADRFWSLLKEQLYAFLENPDEFERHHVEPWTLPTLLATIKEILITVVPSEYCQTVAEALKVELIMQQLSKGAVDLSQLAGWFSQTLKGQCAPMRDTSVDAMTVLLCNGTATKDVPSLVEALKNILSILEVMRLVRSPTVSFTFSLTQAGCREPSAAMAQAVFDKGYRNIRAGISHPPNRSRARQCSCIISMVPRIPSAA